MKKILTLIILCLSISVASAQNKKDKEERREQIKALKVAFITQELNLDTRMAQRFWPIYNRYEEKRRELHRRENIDFDNIGSISKVKAEQMLDEYLQVEREEYLIKKQLFEDLKKIISAEDIIKLHKLEADFNKKLLREYRSRKSNNK